MNYSDEETEKELKRLERKIKKEYAAAYNEMVDRYNRYISGYDEIDAATGKTIHHQGLAERLAQEEEAYHRGAYTKEQWEAYRITQIQRGERYLAMCDDLANRMVNANEVAAAYINDGTPSIYSLNSNYQAYEIGRGKAGVSFKMYDEQTVKNLITGNGNFTEFRTVKVNPIRDYQWNTQKINNALTSAILQGKSIEDLADSFYSVMKNNRNAAMRNARTAYTSAQNGGRMDGLRQAKAMGINVKKQWLSAHDSHVRDSHAILNGQIRDVEEKFDNGCLFPSDPNGRPEEVYNCRCTLTYVHPEYDDDVSSEIFNSSALQGESYKDFVKRMRQENPDAIETNKRLNDDRLVKKYD